MNAEAVPRRAASDRTPRIAPEADAPIVLISGDFTGERVDWARLCRGLGYEAHLVPNLNSQAMDDLAMNHVAVLVLDTAAADWRDTLAAVAAWNSAIPVVLTHSFHSGPPEWEEVLLPIADTLARPLRAAECRQALCLLESARSTAPLEGDSNGTHP